MDESTSDGSPPSLDSAGTRMPAPTASRSITPPSRCGCRSEWCGVLSTGVLVLDSPNEFVLDFIQGLSRPAQIVARVVLPPAVMSQFAAVVRDNLDRYVKSFGVPPALPARHGNGRRSPRSTSTSSSPTTCSAVATPTPWSSATPPASFVSISSPAFIPPPPSRPASTSRPRRSRGISETLTVAGEQFRQRYRQPPKPPQGATPQG